MPTTFWGFLSKTVTQHRISAKRLEYIANQLIETHMYPTFTIADVLKIDKEIDTISYDEFLNLVFPHPPICIIELAGKKRVVYVMDAEECGYPYKRCYSLSEQECMRSNMQYYLKIQKYYDADNNN